MTIYLPTKGPPYQPYTYLIAIYQPRKGPQYQPQTYLITICQPTKGPTITPLHQGQLKMTTLFKLTAALTPDLELLLPPRSPELLNFPLRLARDRRPPRGSQGQKPTPGEPVACNLWCSDLLFRAPYLNPQQEPNTVCFVVKWPVALNFLAFQAVLWGLRRGIGSRAGIGLVSRRSGCVHRKPRKTQRHLV